MTGLQRKLAGWLRRNSIEADLREEMRTHIEMKAADTGDLLSAHRAFGNTALLLEDSRDAWGWPRLESWARDIRYGFRMMTRRPGLAAAVVLTLALGIAASTMVFSLVDTVLLRPLPYPNPDRLIAVSEINPSDGFARTPVAPGRLEDWLRYTTAFEALAGSRTDNLTDTTEPEPQRIPAAFVTRGFFGALGARAGLGRTFREEEERFGGPAVAVISDGLWRRRFGGDGAVIGRSLTLQGERFTIVGVMPSTVQYPSPGTDIWIPAQTPAAVLTLREARFLRVVGRLKAGISVEQAEADLARVQTALGGRYPKTDSGWSVAVRPLKEDLTGSVELALWLLLGSVGLLLSIACINVACLLLGQLNRRRVEIATRLALGCGHFAIARQLFAEGLAYAFAGGLLGLAAAFAGVEALRLRLTGIPRIIELAVNMRLLAFVLAVSVLAAVLFSLAPILQTFRRGVTGAAVRGARGIAEGSQRLAQFLVVAQLALATVLLVGAGLFLRSLVNLQQTPSGFQADHVLALRIGASFGELPESTIPRHQRTLDTLAALPGVTSAAMSSGLPGVDSTWPREFQIAGEPSPEGVLQFAGWRIVTSGYFQTLGISLLAGQTCRMSADPNRAFEAVVNRSFAHRYFKGRDPVGRNLIGGPIGSGTARIVGVAADVKEDGAGKETPPVIYACGYLRFWPDSDVLVRTAHAPAGMTNAVRLALRGIEPARPIYAVRPLTEAMEGTLAQDRFRTVLVSVFASMALTLAAIGLYGVMAYMVTQRTKEIGVRVALGATPKQILSGILRAGGKLILAGTVVGVVLAILASRLLGNALYGVAALDTASYLAAAGALTAVAVLACLIPGRRATALDPVRALRE